MPHPLKWDYNCVLPIRAFYKEVGLPSSIVFRLAFCISGRVTLGIGSLYHLCRVTRLGEPAVCLLKPCRNSRLGEPRRRAISMGLDMM